MTEKEFIDILFSPKKRGKNKNEKIARYINKYNVEGEESLFTDENVRKSISRMGKFIRIEEDVDISELL